MRYVYGPVPSRRLGQSLGVDPIPFKTCNWNCVYCQLGYTAPLTVEREEYQPAEDIVAEIKRVVRGHEAGQIDWITFVGSGEPTLHSRLGQMLRAVKAFTEIPVALITNGSLLYQPDVREEVAVCDAVLPSVDAGSEELYLRINRPQPTFSFERLIDGLAAFNRHYDGHMWVEVMLIRGLNDTAPALEDLARVLRRIEPDEVHINIPIRPPAEPWVEPPDEEGLQRASAILGDVAHVVSPVDGSFDLSGCDDVVDAVIQVIQRHPMSEEELQKTLRQWSAADVSQALERLATDGRAQAVVRENKRFWCFAGGSYVQKHARRGSPEHPG